MRWWRSRVRCWRLGVAMWSFELLLKSPFAKRMQVAGALAVLVATVAFLALVLVFGGVGVDR